MSSAWNKDLVPRSEAVDLAFTSFWSNSVNLKCGTLFYNENLPNDIFFNKLTKLTCLDDKTLDESLTFFEKYHAVPYIYTLNNKEFEKKLERNFKLYDIQHVLIKIPKTVTTQQARRISSHESQLWSEIFCNAYDCHEWIDSVDEIVKKSSNTIGYYIDESSSSCVALYECNSILGLYCLGTIPSMRKKGLAASLVEFALNQTKSCNLDFLMLETYGRDHLLDFYFNLGFEEIYQKNIYTV